jgi:hypothetical protein
VCLWLARGRAHRGRSTRESALSQQQTGPLGTSDGRMAADLGSVSFPGNLGDDVVETLPQEPVRRLGGARGGSRRARQPIRLFETKHSWDEATAGSVRRERKDPGAARAGRRGGETGLAGVGLACLQLVAALLRLNCGDRGGTGRRPGFCDFVLSQSRFGRRAVGNPINFHPSTSPSAAKGAHNGRRSSAALCSRIIRLFGK